MSDRYLITEVRERKDNEFLFGCGERVVACTEFLRFLDFFKNFRYLYCIFRPKVC